MSLWMLHNSDSRLDLALKSFFQFFLLFGHDIEMANLSMKSTFSQTRGMRVIPNPNDDDLIIKTSKSRKEITE